jgi:hypothetical protein
MTTNSPIEPAGAFSPSAPAQVVHSLDLRFKVLDAHLEPFAEGRRSNLVQIDPTFISGRRILRGPAAARP